MVVLKAILKAWNISKKHFEGYQHNPMSKKKIKMSFTIEI
jgi:hypothetical protein